MYTPGVHKEVCELITRIMPCGYLSPFCGYLLGEKVSPSACTKIDFAACNNYAHKKYWRETLLMRFSDS